MSFEEGGEAYLKNERIKELFQKLRKEKDSHSNDYYMIKIYSTSDCEEDKTEWIKAKYGGDCFGWSTDDGYIGDEHPRSKYSTPIKVLTLEQYENLLK